MIVAPSIYSLRNSSLCSSFRCSDGIVEAFIDEGKTKGTFFYFFSKKKFTYFWSMPFFRKYRDDEFIAGLCSGNEKTIKKWQGHCYDHFLKEARKIDMLNYSKDKFNSVYQDSIQALMRNIVSGKFKGESTLVTYFSRIFKFKSIDYDRSKKNPEISTMPEELQERLNWDGGIEVQFTKENLFELLGELKSLCQKIITLTLDGYMDKEIAVLIGKKTDATKKNRQSCFKKYRELVHIHMN